jgi:hypothetical protein
MIAGLEWRKSSFSSDDANCVEVAWRKSSFSTSDANCVEVGWLESPVTAVRDSKNTEGPTLAFPVPAWQDFLRVV